MSWLVGSHGIEVSEYMEKSRFVSLFWAPWAQKANLQISIDMNSYDMEMERELHGASLEKVTVSKVLLLSKIHLYHSIRNCQHFL